MHILFQVDLTSLMNVIQKGQVCCGICEIDYEDARPSLAHPLADNCILRQVRLAVSFSDKHATFACPHQNHLFPLHTEIFRYFYSSNAGWKLGCMGPKMIGPSHCLPTNKNSPRL